MKQTKRQKLILEMIKVSGEVSSKELAEKFGVSTMTISRDLNELAKGGEIHLIYGGATYKEDSIVEKPMSIKELVNINEKKVIGKYCNNIITPGSSIFIETGTTTLAAAKEIFNIKNCTFYTNSLLVMNSLTNYDEINLHSVPGKYRDLSKGFLGIQASEYIQSFNFDYCLIGAEGISVTSGVTLLDNDDAFTKRAVMKQSKCKILVADSSKFGGNFNFLYKIGDVSDFDYIVTDNKLDKKTYQDIKEITEIVSAN
ncbi:DeoR/GlpR family DNA-binding transcription regulator [Oceanobacillus chungangensis]|uniref:DeoR/GlpR transcriptional regulator n=1 Tax=Oceanobacillus chungangensis TaxID=1229152 RepID=A0A3D8PKJ0_9BACI|nr:DeoR/GlpR family DNA-binding transcription regulator [Oceanobacillus chungangensis]RDW16182.1 DeoR/GlpR transcriptional regulator [Oceanobacillus chungangensis]